MPRRSILGVGRGTGKNRETKSKVGVSLVCVYVYTSFETKHVSPAEKNEIWHCEVVLFSQVPKKRTDLDLSLIYIMISGTYSKFTRKNNFLALGVYFPLPWSSAGRRFAASRSRLQYYQRIVLFPQQKFEMRCKIDSTENPPSFKKYPTPP